MSSIPLDLERRCEQRWAARFSAARALQEQHRLERQQHQQLTAPDNSKRKTSRVDPAGGVSSYFPMTNPVNAAIYAFGGFMVFALAIGFFAAPL